jgi:SAM-dependent methyltransferase
VVIVTDVSQDQLDVATRRCVEAGVSNVKFALSNAEDLSQFASASMDVVTCCYGFMFCEDKQRAVAEAYRVLKPGGRLVSTCWKTLVGVELSKATMTAALNGAVPPPPPINPMSLSAPGAFQELLVGAGFRAEDIASSESTYPFVFQGDKERLFKMGSIPIMPKLEEMRQEGKLAEVEAGKAAFWALVEKLSSGSAPRVTVVSPEELHVLDNRFELTVSTKQLQA